MAPVVFPHWFHRIRFQCRVCHAELGFQMRVGATELGMGDLVAGRYCGRCHNGEIAWGLASCGLCHSGREGLPDGIASWAFGPYFIEAVPELPFRETGHREGGAAASSEPPAGTPSPTAVAAPASTPPSGPEAAARPENPVPVTPTPKP
ncbi:MAG: hypothetical protein HYV63_00850 [Candidatus Schekmanbacteria bacterium]|nr:hypothetical protein [Candidatus Schekmanbacteria bacterium]